MKTKSIEQISSHFSKSLSVHEESLETLASKIVKAGEMVTTGLLDSGKVMTCGNGISALQAMHLNLLLLGCAKDNSPGLPSIALTHDLGVSSPETANDNNQFFSRQVHALANENDVLIVFDSMGQSINITQAITAAHQYSIPIVLFTGGNGGQAKQLLEDKDCYVCVPSNAIPHIIEIHTLLIHCLCDYIDTTLFNS